MSWILTDDSLKLSFSTLTKVPFLIFWYDEHPWHANPAHIGCIRDGKWTAWAEIVRQWGVSCVDKIYSWKSDDFFLKVGTLTGTFFIVLWEAWLKLFIFCQSPWKKGFLRRLKYLYIKKYIRFICILKVQFHSIRICKIVQSSTFYIPTIHNFFTLRSFFDPKTEKMKFQLVFSFQRQGAFRTITLFHLINHFETKKIQN